MPNGAVDVGNGAPHLEAYTDNGDGTVTDNVTSLMWQQSVDPGSYKWSAATTYCANLSLGGHADWRLPTIIELVSLVDLSVGDGANPSIDAAFFPTPLDYFWASTPLSGSSSYGWFVYFGQGGTSSYDKTIALRVRCVR
jgi:hypothetical protein